MTSLRPWLTALVAVWLAVPSVVHAQDGQTPPTEENPWSKGVSEEDQKAANDLFKEGNALVRDNFFVQAVDKYMEAVTHWDHPAIHYNLAIALINLDRPLELYDSLQKALQYGTLALDEEKIELAERYKRLVEQQLIWIEVSCAEADAKVFVDGKELFTAPGSKEQLMRAGEHTFSASKPGYETASVTKMFAGGSHEKVAIKLYRPEDLTGYKRRFPTWVPWAVTGGGVLVAGIGGLLHASAASDFEEFDTWAETCEQDTGQACEIGSSQQSLLDGGGTKQTMAGVTYVVGAAAVVTGVTLLLLNRPQPYRLDEEQLGGTAVAPYVTPHGGGITAAIRF